jgi:hypothetical protein
MAQMTELNSQNSTSSNEKSKQYLRGSCFGQGKSFSDARGLRKYD